MNRRVVRGSKERVCPLQRVSQELRMIETGCSLWYRAVCFGTGSDKDLNVHCRHSLLSLAAEHSLSKREVGSSNLPVGFLGACEPSSR